VSQGAYRRSISLHGNHGYFEACLNNNNDGLDVRIQFGDPCSLFFIIERIRRMFDLNADWQAIADTLRADPELGFRIEASPGLRVPGCWDGFELAIRAILGQQVTVKGATTLAGRLVHAFGDPLPATEGLTHLFPRPETLAQANLDSIGLPKARAQTIQALARAVSAGQIRFDGVVDSDVFLHQLLEIPGIGTWTAQYIAMRALGEPDALPSGDIALLRRLDLQSARELDIRAETWRPWRAYAAMYLWSVASKNETSTQKVARFRSPAKADEKAAFGRSASMAV
jgi:AraC family transcriptional regulator of adaptative response / DNA-3-methyladenine glycosylase II